MIRVCLVKRWMPEFDRILFLTPSGGVRRFGLRRRSDGSLIHSSSLSAGTLLTIALLALTYVLNPPPIIGLEEPDRGIHPRLLREVQGALYRLAYPENFEIDRPAVQVVATTHSPYMLDLYRDHPEEIVIAQKEEGEATFERLSDREDFEKILSGAPLGQVWFSGVLGGVPPNS